MMKKRTEAFIVAATAVIFFMVLSAASTEAEVKVSFLYSLADFYGVVPIAHARVTVDQSSGEIYVLSHNSIKIFSGTGMQVYEFGDDLEVGYKMDVAVDEETNIFLLTQPVWNEYSIVRCDYRGNPVAKFRIKDLPADFEGFVPSGMVYAKGNLYFLSPGEMKFVVTDRNGNFRNGYSIKPLLELDEEKKKEDMNIDGFSVDRDGNIVFTIATLFRVFKLSPDGAIVKTFGQPGSVPGKFNLVKDVVTDDRGSFLVVDALRSKISVFDKDYNFLLEFGGRGVDRGSLFAPSGIALEGGKIYVSQARNKGISVFRLAYE